MRCAGSRNSPKWNDFPATNGYSVTPNLPSRASVSPARVGTGATANGTSAAERSAAPSRSKSRSSSTLANQRDSAATSQLWLPKPTAR